MNDGTRDESEKTRSEVHEEKRENPGFDIDIINFTNILSGFAASALWAILLFAHNRDKAGLMIIGLLCCIVAFLTSTAWLYVLYKDSPGKRPSLAVRVFLFFLISMVIIPMLCPSSHGSGEKARRIHCASNLKQIGLALAQYAMDNKDQFPPVNGAAGLEYLRREKYCTDHRIYTCPSSKTRNTKPEDPLTENTLGYVYAGAGLSLNDAPDSPIAWDKPSNHKNYGNILFVDGHVQGFPGASWLGNLR